MRQELRGVDVDFVCDECQLESDMKRAMRSRKKLRGRNGKYHIAEKDSIRLYGEGDPMKSKVPVHIEEENRLRRGIELSAGSWTCHGLDSC